jgi:hypothetical protein
MTTMEELPRRSKLHRSNRRKEETQLVVCDEDVPDLRTLVIPWASMVIVAVIATGVVLYNNHCNGEDGSAEDKYYSSFFFDTGDLTDEASSSKGSILERLLSTVTVEQHHVHKPVYEENHPPLFPLSMADRLGFTLAIIGLMIAAGGGIGGGGILVPIYILVMGFSPKHGTLVGCMLCCMVKLKKAVFVSHKVNSLAFLLSYSDSFVEHYRLWWSDF